MYSADGTSTYIHEHTPPLLHLPVYAIYAFSIQGHDHQSSVPSLSHYSGLVLRTPYRISTPTPANRSELHVPPGAEARYGPFTCEDPGPLAWGHRRFLTSFLLCPLLPNFSGPFDLSCLTPRPPAISHVIPPMHSVFDSTA